MTESQKEKRKRRGQSTYLKKMKITENFHNMGKEINKANFRSRNQRGIQGRHTDGQWAHEKMLNITNVEH